MSQNARILVVDDEPQWLRSLSHILGGAGYVVRQAASGEDTLASLAGGAPDLILLDIRMRGMDGFEVFRKIREHEEWSSIPVIMVSGLVEAKERAAGIEMGASDFITKPFDPEELLARVRMQLDMARMRSEQVRHAEALEAANEKLRAEIAGREQAEDELQESEALFRALLDSSPFPVALADVADDNIKFWSRSATAIFGHTPQKTTDWYEMAYPDPDYRREVIGRWKPFLEEARRSGQAVNTGEYRITCRDGSVRICELHAAFLGDNLVVTFNDITERKAAEARIVRLTQLYAALSQCNQAIVHSTSAEELFPKICRDSVEFGGMKMSWVGMVDEGSVEVRPVTSFGSGTGYLDEISILTDLADPLGRGPTGTAIREGKPVWCQDFLNDPSTEPWREGGALHGWASSAALPLRLMGRTIGAFTVYSGQPGAFDEEARDLLEEMGDDISFALEGYKREEELSKLEEQNRSILKTAMDGFVLMDLQGRVRAVNDSYCRMVGYREEELLTMGIGELEASETREQTAAHIQQIVSQGQDRFESRHRCSDGTLIDVEVSIQFRPSDNLLAIFVRDVTSLKAMNAKLVEALSRAESASRAKSEFLAIMSHELRTPLNGVLGFAELLAETHLDDEQREHARMIASSGSHLLAIVSDILDFASIEKGTMAIRVAPMAVADVVNAAADMVRNTASEKGIAFRCEVAAGVPEKITADGERIRQILINLLGNAVKFTSSGSVVLRVVPASEDGRNFLDFSVEDTGIGISSETLSRLFHPFVQADSSFHRSFGGTGLGLAISKRIAEAMGGSITLVSAPGKGSTFTFRLPLEASGPASSDPAVAVPIEQEPVAHPGNLVLVADDDRDSLTLAGKMLETLGYRAEFAVDGAETLQAFVPGKFSAILMDMAMPVMDGLEATKKIREAEADAGSHVPIIALTANVMPGDRERCLASGMDDFLTKPFKRAELAAKLACISHTI